MNLDNIPKEHQANTLSIFWTMLRECESKAHCNEDTVLRVWVEQWYDHWNKVTGDDKKPTWVGRKIDSSDGVMRLINVITQTEIKVGDLISDSKGNTVEVVYFAKPHKPTSSGKISTKPIGADDSKQTESYAHVYNLVWINRDDQ